MSGDEDDKTRLNPPSDDATRVAGAQSQQGSGSVPGRVGAYRLIRELGSGGMGQVFLAEQTEPVQRQVALKLISQADHAVASVFFEVERQMLARLHHPAIAQIYDAGTSDHGAPWFAMELVEGQPVTRHCQDHQLGREQVLRLFVRICQGVQHAHQRGVIHRDLKPGNILVARIDGQSIPKIIDFGVATSMARRDAPAVDFLHGGTPAYMSPEQLSDPQFAGDARSDVFALGVLLFELLLGCRPPRGEDESGLLGLQSVLLDGRSTISGSTRILIEQLAPEDRDQIARLTRRLPMELRCILVKALAVAPDERYASADALANDLSAFLLDRPVSAVPDSPAYRLRKFLWRHRVPVGFAATVSVALVVGLMVAVWGLLQAQEQRDQARLQAERAEQTVSFMQQMLGSIDPDFAQGADTVLMRRVLEDAAERVASELADQPVIAADILHAVGTTYTAIGDFHKAKPLLNQALELASAADRPETSLRAAYGLAMARRNLGELDAVISVLPELIERAEALGWQGGDRYIDMQISLAETHAEAGQREQALAIVEPLVEMLAQRDDPLALRNWLDARNVMARAYQDLGELERAEQTYQETIAIAEAGEQPGLERHLANAVNSLAVVYLQDQRPDRAEPLLRRSIELTEKRMGSDDNALLFPIVSNLASSLRQQNKFDQAAEVFQRAHRLALDHFGEDNPRTLVVRYNMGNLHRELGELEQALALHQWVYGQADEVFPESHPVHGMSRLGLGRTLFDLGQYAQAAEMLQQAQTMLEAFYGPDYHRAREAGEYLQLSREAMMAEAE